jgi:hypothetical protein
MTDKYWRDGHWVPWDFGGGYAFFPAGYRDDVEGTTLREEPKHFLSMMEVTLLVDMLKKEGRFVDKIVNNQVREEDLKITHRLLNIIEKGIIK